MCAARLSILLATYFQLSSICVHPCNIQFNPPFYFVKAFTHMNFKYFHSPVDLAFISPPPSTHLLFILCTTVCICSCLCVFYSCWSDLPLYTNSYPVHTLILTLSQYFLTRTHIHTHLSNIFHSNSIRKPPARSLLPARNHLSSVASLQVACFRSCFVLYLTDCLIFFASPFNLFIFFGLCLLLIDNFHLWKFHLFYNSILNPHRVNALAPCCL